MVTDNLKRTPLFNQQSELGGRFVGFHGWELPIQFSSIIQEHKAVRSSCGLFDVSHMGQFFVSGPHAIDLIQKVNTNDAAKLKDGRAMYSHMLNERGGVIDDVIFSRLEADRWLIVVNAATIAGDLDWIRGHAHGMDVQVEDRSEGLAMIALQGPKAAGVVSTVSAGAADLKRFGALEELVYGQQCVFTRTGYTGEDGFEIIAPAEIIVRIWLTLMANGQSHGLLPCGLGARDTLRLEAGYLLYGNDIDVDHTPLEAQYDWVVKWEKGDFIGKEALQRQKREGLHRKLYGVRLLEKGVPRAGSVVARDGEKLGPLLSATFSPTFSTGIGMGYLERPDLAAGTEVTVEVRGRALSGEIVQMPFYKLGG